MDWSVFGGQLVGVIVGGLIGFLSSNRILQSQRRDEQRNIALGFQKELEIHQGWLSLMPDEYREAALPRVAELSQRPIITSNSLYYVWV